MRGLVFVRADWEADQCCRLPASPTWRHRINVFAYVCRRVSEYRERSMLEAMDDHLLDDIGVDIASVRRATSPEGRAIRRLCRISSGGFY